MYGEAPKELYLIKEQKVKKMSEIVPNGYTKRDYQKKADWQKNPTPRMMWVWSFDEDHKVQRKVIYVLKAGVYENPVLTVVDECTYETYKHCAEIEKQRRMTNKESEMTDDLYYRKLESTSTSDLVDMLREKDRRIAELEEENEGLKAFESHCDEIEEDAKAIAKENAELKEKLDKIRKYLVYDIFDRFKYLENLLKISQETQEELCKRIIEQQKTIGSLTDLIYELKAQIGKM